MQTSIVVELEGEDFVKVSNNGDQDFTIAINEIIIAKVRPGEFVKFMYSKEFFEDCGLEVKRR